VTTSGGQRPRSTRAQIVTSVCAALCAVGVTAGALFMVVGVQIAGAVFGGLGSVGDEAVKAVSVPTVETACLNYAATVLDLNAAGLDHDAIVRVMENALSADGLSPDAVAEIRELSLMSADFCGPVRDVLTAAGR
jgi:hypothetical protein